MYLKVEELNSDAGGKAKVLAEPVMLATLGKPITFNCGKDVPLKIPLAEGLESIEYGWMLDRARLCPEVSALRCQETVRRLEVSIDRSSRDPASAVRSASGK